MTVEEAASIITKARNRCDELLARSSAKLGKRKREADERGVRIDEKLAQLQEAQARAAEQIRLLMESNGSKEN